MNIEYKRATTEKELRQILTLQKENAIASLEAHELEKEGFVTVAHSYEILKKMNDACAHIIAKDNDAVIGYALVMLKEFRDEISVLSAMFETATELLGEKNYVAMGQVCVSKNYRKQGVFRGMYHYYKQELEQEFDCLLTEVATSNQRSLKAHLSIGFTILKTQVSDGVSWELINWDWR
ncbi:MAG: GNAT family N-acetyltransferase [Flavobacteriaceae bacterium]